MDKAARTNLLERILLDLGFKTNNRSWPFMEDGRRKLATLHADKLWGVVEIIDLDDIQIGEKIILKPGEKLTLDKLPKVSRA